MEKAQRQIRQDVQASQKLQNRNIKICHRGSYRNRVSVRRDSNVDIGVVCFDAFFPESPDDNVKALLEKSFTDGVYNGVTDERGMGRKKVYN